MDRDYAVIMPEDMEAKPALPVLIPLVAVLVSAMPNINDVLYMSPMGRKSAVGYARKHGYKIGLDIARALDIPVKARKIKGARSLRELVVEMSTQSLTDRKIFTILYIWHPASKKNPLKSDRKRDVYNPLVKATIDGLTDAGLWEDDNTEYHTDYWVSYRGLAPTGKIILAFYAKGDDHGQSNREALP